MSDPLKGAKERIEAAEFAREAGDPNWAFGLTLAIVELSYCIKENWQWSDSDASMDASPMGVENATLMCSKLR